MKGIRNESQRANGVTCDWGANVSCQRLPMLDPPEHVKTRLRTCRKLHEEKDDIENKEKRNPG